MRFVDNQAVGVAAKVAFDVLLHDGTTFFILKVDIIVSVKRHTAERGLARLPRPRHRQDGETL